MKSFIRFLILPTLVAILSGCHPNADCSEFAPPTDRVQTTCPGTPVNPAAAAKPAHQRYCYRTLAQTDCYDTPQPQIAPSYIGTYPN